MSDDLLNNTGKQLAEDLGMTQGELLGGLKSTKYRLSWMQVENATLEYNNQEFDQYKRSLGNACKAMIESLSEILNYNDIQKMKQSIQSVSTEDADKLLKAVEILNQILSKGLIDSSTDEYHSPDVHVENIDDAIELGERLRKAKNYIKSTSIHSELSN